VSQKKLTEMQTADLGQFRRAHVNYTAPVYRGLTPADLLDIVAFAV
jgi:hypothetical protein